MSNLAPTFYRCPHDKQNAYSIISRDLIRDNSISVECRWMLIYMLTHRDDWVINITQLVNFCKGNLGKEKIYKLIKEAIEAGYLLRETHKEGNLNRTRYLVSESPKFKKCFRHPGFQEDGGSSRRETDTKVYQSKDIASKESPIVPKGEVSSSRKKIKEEKQKVALEVYLTPTQIKSLQEKLKNDSAKESACYTKLSEWKVKKGITGGSDYGHMVKWVIKRVEEDCLRPQPVNREEADKVVARRLPKHPDIVVGHNYVEFNLGINRPHIKFGDHGFKEQIENNLRKMGLKQLNA